MCRKNTTYYAYAKGKVSVNGMEWTARSVDGSIIEAAEIVTVKEVSGVKLICEK